MPQINYLNKTFSDYQKTLIDFIKAYYKDSITNLTETDPAKIYIDLLSYVGDVLSFYIDYNFKENIFLYADNFANVILLSQQFGYRPRIVSPATVELSVFQIIPSKEENGEYIPDMSYALHIDRGMKVSLQGKNIFFRTIENLNFALNESNNPLEVSIYDVDNFGNPLFFLLKKKVKAQSIDYLEYDYTINEAIPDLKIVIPDENVIGIESVIDSEGNIWYETDFLARDTIFDYVENWDPITKDIVPYILRLKYVPKRFITRYDENLKLYLKFGSGILPENTNELYIPHLENIGLMNQDQRNIGLESYNISNFLFTSAYGEVPQNTTLTIKYIKAVGSEGNVLPHTIQKVEEINILNDSTNLDIDTFNLVKNSITVDNEQSATGGLDQESVDSIKEKATAYFTAQNRCVTKEDYLFRTLSMPSKLGNISKAFVKKNLQSQVEIYVLSQNDEGKLIPANYVLKQNLATYLDQYRILTDEVFIKDAYIVNFKIKFSISILKNYNNNDVLRKAILKLSDYFNINSWQINQPIIIAEVKKELQSIEGVQYVQGIEFEPLFDEDMGYSPVFFDFNSANINGIIYPATDPMIFEIRFPEQDIEGRII